MSPAFPHVPEEVAREWLHRHWRHSPFGWLPSAAYRFSVVSWPAAGLTTIRCNWNDFAEDPAAILDHGEYLAEEHRSRFGYWLGEYMVKQGDFPSRPVILDNLDGHLKDRLDDGYYPKAYLLIEGHNRFKIACYLASQGRMRPTVEFWLMTRT